ncbi:hypothetical protein [Caldicellulosiruptor naganoensis]|uniref:DUF4830 domain-containing protein n=1 Tax=Caldicellulosiruptor naganoensis TaxID=29324 RepID=A0ABY7BE18_9FIRM|nr:hypothetical protein [Caldicellulosiruptor naganoensis]WAM31073.1 hypothetical protein OTJ99_001885 [Caldicellulosiruptor naganoensis]
MKLYFKTAILTAIIIFLFLVSFAVGFTITIEKSKIKSKQQLKGKNITEIAYIKDSYPQRIDENTILIVRKYFKACGHIVEEKSNIPQEYFGMVKEDFRRLFSAWEIDAFNSKYVVISRIFEGYCSHHFIVSIKDGRVAIFYSQPVDGDNLKLITPYKY